MTFVVAAYSHADRAPVALTAFVHQDGGEHTASELLVLWTPDADAVMADFDAEERVGAAEEIERRYWAREETACYASRARNAIEDAVGNQQSTAAE